MYAHAWRWSSNCHHPRSTISVMMCGRGKVYEFRATAVPPERTIDKPATFPLRFRQPPQLHNAFFNSGYSLQRFTRGRNIFLSTSLPSFSACACSPAQAHMVPQGTHCQAAHLCGSIGYHDVNDISSREGSRVCEKGKRGHKGSHTCGTLFSPVIVHVTKIVT